MSCTHTPAKRDKEEGYQNCMWCHETGECNGTSGECDFHSVTWQHFDDIANPVDTDPGWDRDDKGNIIYDQRYYS